MYTEVINLWENPPGLCEETPLITYYKPDNKVSDMAILIAPGGGYSGRSPSEGPAYAEFLADKGYTCFVLNYRTNTHKFPIPLLDARRAIRTIRFYADKFGVDKNKIAMIGSSAGGHLTALTSTYKEPVDFEGLDEIDKEKFMPDAQILCYPVINIYDKNIAHIWSGNMLIGDDYEESNDVVTRRKLSPNLLVSEATPPAFIWHTAEDEAVDVHNSLEYASALKTYGISTEMHIFPHGPHGLGLAGNDTPLENHVRQWSDLLIKWIKYMGW